MSRKGRKGHKGRKGRKQRWDMRPVEPGFFVEENTAALLIKEDLPYILFTRADQPIGSSKSNVWILRGWEHVVIETNGYSAPGAGKLMTDACKADMVIKNVTPPSKCSVIARVFIKHKCLATFPLNF